MYEAFLEIRSNSTSKHRKWKVSVFCPFIRYFKHFHLYWTNNTKFSHFTFKFLNCSYIYNNMDTSEGAFPEHTTFSFCFILVELANINIIKSLRIAVLMIIKKCGTSVILCFFVVRYIFGQFLQEIWFASTGPIYVFLQKFIPTSKVQ